MISKKSIFQNKIFITALFVAILEPDIFKNYYATDVLFTGLKFLMLVVVSVKYFSLVNLKKRGNFSIWIFAYCAGLILTTFINDQDTWYAIKKLIECFLISMAFETGTYYNGKKFLKWLFDYLLILIVINALLIIPFPNGLVAAKYDSANYKMFFLCIKNGMINWMSLTAIAGVVYLSCEPNAKFNRRYNLFLLVAYITIIYTASSTGIILFSLYLIYYIISKVYDFKLSLSKVMPILIIVYFGVIILGWQNNLPKIFLSLFGKDASFSGRDNLWNNAIYYFLNSPIWGNGIRENSLINFYGRSYTSHNFFLELLMDGGIFQLCIFAAVIIVLILQISKCNDNDIKNHLTIAFVLFFLSGLTEAHVYQNLWFGVLTLIYMAPKFDIEVTNYKNQLYLSGDLQAYKKSIYKRKKVRLFKGRNINHVK